MTQSPADIAMAPCTEEHIEELKSWFPDRATAYVWGGPGLRYPWTDETFMKDIHWGEIPSWSSLNEHGRMQGFGQYYPKEGRCQLARLAVSPSLRGQGFGKTFIEALMRIGMQDLGTPACSLFVAMNNPAAVGCYQSLGFEFAPWPDWMDHIEGIRFMLREPEKG